MPFPLQYSHVTALPANEAGKDYVVGDLHGMYDRLINGLTTLNFDPSVDRVFSVGDMVDRGKDSYKCGQLIYEPWFYAVRGNHEQMVIDAVCNGSNLALCTWLQNGGASWKHTLEADELTSFANDLEKLPLIITVGNSIATRFNIVHAELIKTNRTESRHPLVTNEMIDSWEFSNQDVDSMLWGRSMFHGQYGQRHDENKLSQTYVGHTGVGRPTRIQQQIYIDTGAVYGGDLTIVCHTTGIGHLFDQQGQIGDQFQVSMLNIY